jgi:hypothetical protein
MDRLVICACGHGVGQHGAHGCEGASGRPCTCAFAPADVVDAAVRDVKTYYDRAWRSESGV